MVCGGLGWFAVVCGNSTVPALIINIINQDLISRKITRQRIKKNIIGRKRGPAKTIFGQKSGPAMAVPPTTALGAGIILA